MATKAPQRQIPPVRFGQEEPCDFTCLDEFLAQSYAPRRTRTIHLGCGNGRTTVYLVQKGHRVLGIDPDRDLLASARERAVLAEVELDLMAGDPLLLPPLPEESFGLAVDLFTACDLAEGVERENYLRGILKLLMRGGILVASAPAPRRPATERGKGPPEPKEQTFAFASPFVSDFTRAGFEVLFEGLCFVPTGELRLMVHARKSA